MIHMSPEVVVILMFASLIVGLALGHPIAFVLGGIGVVFGIIGWGPASMHLIVSRAFDSTSNYLLIAIPLFILMATFLEKSGIAEGLFNSMLYLFGPLNGAIALTVVTMCIVFAACTGIMGATVVSMSLMSMPIMMRHKYDKHLATGIVAAGGSLGIIIPPSIMLVMMADRSGISVGKLFAGGLIPGVLLAVLFFIYIAILCSFRPDKGPALTIEERTAIPLGKKVVMLLKNLVPPLLLIFGVLGSIWFGIATPSEAAGVGALTSLALMVIYGRFTLNAFKDALNSAFKSSCMVMAVIIGATCFTGVFIGLGGGKVVTDLIMAFDFMGRWGMFTIMMLIVFILGFLIDWIGIIYITFPIFMPIAIQLGFDPLWFVIVLAVNLQMSFITPPFGYALFYVKGTVTPDMGIKLIDIYKGIIPFVLLQMLGLVIVSVWPKLATWLPSLVGN